MNNKINRLLVNVADVALRRRARLILKAQFPKEGDCVLDVGCGDGYYLFLLYKLNSNIYSVGTDSDRNALSAAYETFKSNNIPVELLSEEIYKKEFLRKGKLKKGKVYLVWADLMEKLPFENKFFDRVVMGEVAEHLPNDVKGLKEVRRVMKRNAVLTLTVPCSNYPFLWDPINWILERTFKTHIRNGFFAGIWNQHIRLYTPEKIKHVVQKAGFKVEECYANTFWSIPFNHHVVNLGARILYGGSMPPQIAESVNKYSVKISKPLLLRSIFKVLDTIDSINDKHPNSTAGVGVFVKAINEEK